MGVGKFIRDIYTVAGTLGRSTYRPAERRDLLLNYVRLRTRNVLAYRFGAPRLEHRMLGYRVRYLDPSFFNTNLYEVFIEEDYFFAAGRPDPVITTLQSTSADASSS